MADITNSLAAAMQLSGAIAVGLVDMESGRCVAGCGIERLDLDSMAVGNTDALRTKMRLLQEMGVRDEIEEIIVTTADQIHLIRTVRNKGSAGLFLFLALDRRRTDLGLVRFKFAQIERDLIV